jgi:hypothetical protein
MKYAAVMFVFAVAGCGGALDVGEDPQAIKERGGIKQGIFSSGSLQPGQFAQLTFDGNGGFTGQLCVTAACLAGELLPVGGSAVLNGGPDGLLHGPIKIVKNWGTSVAAPCSPLANRLLNLPVGTNVPVPTTIDMSGAVAQLTVDDLCHTAGTASYVMTGTSCDPSSDPSCHLP